MSTDIKHSSSFRDPAGFIFFRDGELYRQINKSYKNDYDYFMENLYRELIEKSLLIPHEELEIAPSLPNIHYKTVKPKKIPFVSYPYEWSFSQLKDAALLTLSIQKIALKNGIALKDCSAFNVQFIGSKPIFIDTLSFDKYIDGSPWVAYKQFCQHFLAPLSLACYKDVRLTDLLKSNLDGIPLDLASRLLPKRTLLNFSLLAHIHLHSKSQKHFQEKSLKATKKKVSKLGLLGLIDSLESAIRRLKLPRSNFTGWSDYYDKTNYTKDSFNYKKDVLNKYLTELKPTKIWDLGANTGVFSRVYKSESSYTVSFDLEPLSVEANYLESKSSNSKQILPLVIDLFNPTPSLGWNERERASFKERGPCDCILALALIHHLIIGNNLSFEMVAEFLHDLCSNLIIEFVPKEDSQVKKMLRTREDIFIKYNIETFKEAFSKRFDLMSEIKLKGSLRSMLLFRSK